MTNFTKIIMPCRVLIGEQWARVFCKISYTDGKLSITGVEGPRQNGDCWGSCGQIDMGYWHRNAELNDKSYHALKKPTDYFPGWTASKFQRFLEVWREWHLNDMQAGCEHQRALKWGSNEIVVVEYGLTDKIRKAVKDIQGRSQAALAKGLTVTLDADSISLLALLPHLKGAVGDARALAGKYRETKRETKTDGWVYPTEHPDGKLTKPCPECGYEYGTKWLKVEVPADVLEFLQGLPDAAEKPAWV